MTKSPLLLLAAFLLSACVTTRDSYLPDGSLGHHITCGGALFSMGDCVQKAGDICGAGGYKIVNQNGEAIPYSTSSGGFSGSSGPYGGSVAGGYHSSSGSIVQRDLFVKCKKEPVKKASAANQE